jgi:hypothetical protein
MSAILETTMTNRDNDEWNPVYAALPAEPNPHESEDKDDDPDPEDETIAGDDEPAPEPAPKEKPRAKMRVKRSVEECEGLVSGIDDETVALLLTVLAKEAIERGIDPVQPVAAARVTAGGGPRASMNDLWGRIVTRVDRSKKGGFRFEGSPIYGRSIIGRDLSSIGVSEDGKTLPVVFGRKDMRGTMWLALAEKGASFDMAGTLVTGMSLRAWSNNFDDFEKLCNVAEALVAGVDTLRIETRRTTEATLASLDEWE